MHGCRQRRRTNCRRCSRTVGSRITLNISFNNACTRLSIALSVRANAARNGGAQRPDDRDAAREQIDMPRDIQLELLPHERAALLKWNFTSEVRSQLEACASSDDVETITIDSVHLLWLASDLTHAIVKLGCRDEDVIDLSERLDFVEQTGNGSLDAWH